MPNGFLNIIRLQPIISVFILNDMMILSIPRLSAAKYGILTPTNQGHYTVYLPAYDDKTLLKYLNQTRRCAMANIFETAKNAITGRAMSRYFPVNNEAFNKSLASCEGLLTGGGFEGPAEALYLQKESIDDTYDRPVRAAMQCAGGIKTGRAGVQAIDEHFVHVLNQWIAR